jgi:membrane-bound serine protease (ClpP class)
MDPVRAVGLDAGTTLDRYRAHRDNRKAKNMPLAQEAEIAGLRPDPPATGGITKDTRTAAAGFNLQVLTGLSKILPLPIMRLLKTLILLAATIAGMATARAADDKASAPDTSAAAPVRKKAIVIPIEEQVDFGLYAFLKRAVAEALEKKPDVIVFKVNTYGGELQSAFDIVDLLMGVSQCSTYAYVEQKAISAGALISLSCNRIAMGNGTTIGDCAPITQGQDGIVMLGEKIQSPLRAKFRTLAEKNGYPSLLAQAMVTSDIGVVAGVIAGAKDSVEYFTVKQWDALGEKGQAKYKSHKIIVPEGQLLTLTDREAAQYGFSQGSYSDLKSFLDARGWTQIGDVATSWSENLVRVIGKFAPILMIIGFGALYMEFKTPGMSIFGVIGAACLLIVFGSKYAVGLADHTELLLLLAGFACVIAEMYLFPGTLVAGIIGLLLIVAALTLSLQDFTLPDPSMPWEMKGLIDNLFTTVGSMVAALIIPIVAVRFVLPHLPAGHKVISETTLADARSVAPETARVAVGAAGRTKTPLRPAGKAVFGGETLEVVSRGEFIEAGIPVEIARIDGNNVIVRRAQGDA